MNDINHVIDRSGWPSGPWDNEPDCVEWKSEAGFPAFIVRNHLGALCGYVGVPPEHSAHGKGYWSDVPVSVHGGLTYAGECQGRICHVPAPGETDDVWWFGFDCAHYGDTVPGMLRFEFGNPPVTYYYKDVDYVRSEVESLAKQLKEVK